jgi:hypothetical protein
MSYQVSEGGVRQLFSNMGYDVGGVDREKLQRKIGQLQQYVADGEDLTDTGDLNLRDEILERLNNGEKIELTEETCATQAEEKTTVIAELPDGTEELQSVSSSEEEAAEGVALPTLRRGRRFARTTPKSPKTPRQGENDTANGPVVAKRSKKASGAKILEYSACQVIHWMGYNGFTTAEAQTVLDHYQVVMKPASLRTYLTDGRRKDEKFVKKDLLNEEQAKELQAIRQKVKKEEPATEPVAETVTV